MKVNIKWNKELLKDIEVDESQPPEILKTQIFSLTGIPLERQKILVKGAVLKDDSWGKIKLKEGQTIMLMGTANALREPTEEEIQKTFVQVQKEEEEKREKVSPGLKNLGNTCYMNSTLQCLYSVEDFRRAIVQQAGGNESLLVTLAQALFKEMALEDDTIQPIMFLHALKQQFPQFAQANNQGIPMQQDAEECWSQLLSEFKRKLPVSSDNAKSITDALFGIEFQKKFSSEESGEEIQEEENAYMLKCNIEIGIDYLNQGIELALKNDREQHSQKLGQTVVFKGQSKIKTLPPYLTIQLVRFYYKPEIREKAKILRKVAFPKNLDVYDFCTEELQKQLAPSRSAARKIDDQKAGVSRPSKVDMGKENEGGSKEEVDMEVDEKSLAGTPTGHFSLIACLTHKGRSADSGHYEAWVRQENGQWVEYDDDKLTLRTEDEILALSGGGDWHMAYLLVYKSVNVPEVEAAGAASASNQAAEQQVQDVPMEPQ